MFAPIFVTVMSYLQDWMHFCTGFGILGIYNLSDTNITVEEKEYLRLDRIKALKILGYAAAMSIPLVGAIVYVL